MRQRTTTGTAARPGAGRVLFAAIAGTVIEWYDYALYGTAAGLSIGRCSSWGWTPGRRPNAAGSTPRSCSPRRPPASCSRASPSCGPHPWATTLCSRGPGASPSWCRWCSSRSRCSSGPSSRRAPSTNRPWRVHLRLPGRAPGRPVPHGGALQRYRAGARDQRCDRGGFQSADRGGTDLRGRRQHVGSGLVPGGVLPQPRARGAADALAAVCMRCRWHGRRVRGVAQGGGPAVFPRSRRRESPTGRADNRLTRVLSSQREGFHRLACDRGNQVEVRVHGQHRQPSLLKDLTHARVRASLR